MTIARRTWSHPLVLTLALAFPTVAAWLYFNWAARGDGTPNPLAQMLYTGSKLLQFGLPLVWLAWFAPQRLQPARFRWDGIGIGVVFGLVVALALFGLYAVAPLGDMPMRVRAKISEFHLDTWSVYVIFGLFLCVIHAFLEEWYWRGFVHAGLREWLTVPSATLMSSVGFAAHHVVILHAYLPNRFWLATVPLAVAIAVGGAVWAWLYERTGSLYGPWLSHLLVDAMLIVVGGVMVFG